VSGCGVVAFACDRATKLKKAVAFFFAWCRDFSYCRQCASWFESPLHHTPFYTTVELVMCVCCVEQLATMLWPPIESPSAVSTRLRRRQTCPCKFDATAVVALLVAAVPKHALQKQPFVGRQQVMPSALALKVQRGASLLQASTRTGTHGQFDNDNNTTCSHAAQRLRFALRTR